MAQRITPEQIQTMRELYKNLKTYSAVAREMGISASTVSRYLKQPAAAPTVQPISLSYIAPSPIESISKESILSFSDITEEEQSSYNAWIKEFH